VLRLVGVGRTNSQIARDLFISPKTASAHLSPILVKLDVGSRSQATTAGHRRGLLSRRLNADVASAPPPSAETSPAARFCRRVAH
jgi:FixJ family two-component response regulator